MLVGKPWPIHVCLIRNYYSKEATSRPRKWELKFTSICIELSTHIYMHTQGLQIGQWTLGFIVHAYLALDY